MNNISGKTVLITGASSGIGRSFAYQCAQKWAHLIIVSRTESVLLDMAWDIHSKYSVSVEVIVGDLSQKETPQMIFDEVEKRGLSVDILVNNAGFGKWVSFLSQKVETYQEMITLNIASLVTLTHLFLPKMLEKKSGGIINVASIAAFFPCPYISVYGATKAFVLSFTEALAGEYNESGVKIMALCPGNTETGFQKIAQVDLKGEMVESADQVVKNALGAYEKGKIFIVSGWSNKILTSLPRFLSRSWILKIIKKSTQKSAQQ